jgi:hypothetical protein
MASKTIPEHGWLAAMDAWYAVIEDDDTTRGRSLDAAATRLGRQLGSAELEAVGIATEGLALVTEGLVDEGMPPEANSPLSAAVAASSSSGTLQAASPPDKGTAAPDACEDVGGMLALSSELTLHLIEVSITHVEEMANVPCGKL